METQDNSSLERIKTVTSDEAARLIHENAGSIFSCDFVKRSTGELRKGRFRVGYTVQKGLKGGDAPYSFSEKNLIPVYRMAGDTSESDGQRRTIPIEGIQKLVIGGETYNVTR